ncbi:Transposable element Tc3 transposase [Pseudolycoriella hygida]|uniref:Transposable element Tc3 transposase n=1 Tax=Pseudolycoriella hygida TaxID=35572 RepID=A0A9Q0S3I7_9DIPT|nr:Transposable element Tc3 transposase [Pseudolycoriella hygida]
MKPKVEKGIKDKIEKMKIKIGQYYNRTAHKREPIVPGDDVAYRKNKTWEPAKVVNRASTPRSFIIETEPNQILRRNMIHLRKSNRSDNCSIHTAKVCQQWFKANTDLVRLETPVNSPDLNPIENVWAEMVREWNNIYPRNIKNLDRVVMNKWEELRNNPAYFESLYRSMPVRLNAVIDANGGHTKY